MSGNEAPIVYGPPEVKAVAGTAFTVSAEIIDSDTADLAEADATVALTGLVAERGKTPDGRTIATLRGIIPRDVVPGDYTVTWTASDGQNPAVNASTKIQVSKPAESGKNLISRIERLVKGRYVHGLPEQSARELGPDAVPILTGLLRNDDYKADWGNIVATLAIISTPDVFDTLNAFVWSRFRGEVDRDTYHAILSAHTYIWNTAPTRPEVIEYLERTADPGTWSALPWRLAVGSMKGRAKSFSAISINGLSCVVTPAAIQALYRMRESPFIPNHVPNIREGIARQVGILRKGREAQLREDLRQLGGAK